MKSATVHICILHHRMNGILHTRKAQRRQVFKVSTGIEYNSPSPTDFFSYDRFTYADSKSYEAILSEITPSLVSFKELAVSEINIQAHPSHVLPSERTFISRDRQPKLDTASLSEKWHIGAKRAANTMRATTQRGTRSAITPVSR